MLVVKEENIRSHFSTLELGSKLNKAQALKLKRLDDRIGSRKARFFFVENRN